MFTKVRMKYCIYMKIVWLHSEFVIYLNYLLNIVFYMTIASSYNHFVKHCILSVIETFVMQSTTTIINTEFGRARENFVVTELYWFVWICWNLSNREIYNHFISAYTIWFFDFCGHRFFKHKCRLCLNRVSNEWVSEK